MHRIAEKEIAATGQKNLPSGKFRRFKWELVILLWLVFFFNQADRQLFNVVLPLIKADLGLSDAALGLVASVFIWAIGICVPVAGFVGDIFSKKRVIMFSLLLWSTATLFTGLSAGLLHLIVLRAVVGSSESFYAPSANALISENYRADRGLALSIHQTSLYVGVIMSGLLGAVVAENFGWSAAFYFFGGFGILLSVVLVFRFRKLNLFEPGGTDRPASRTGRQMTLLTGIKCLFEKKTAVLLTFAFACMVFVNVGYLTWTPTFFREKFNLSLSGAGFSSMFYHHIFAFLGVLAGGKLSDRLAVKDRSYRLKIQAAGLLLGAPFIYLLGASGNLFWAYLALSLFGLFRGMYDSNIYASLYTVIAPEVRASVSGIMIMFAFLAGASAPAILGYLKPTLGLSAGISWLALAYMAGAVAIAAALKFTLPAELVPERKQ